MINNINGLFVLFFLQTDSLIRNLPRVWAATAPEGRGFCFQG